MIMFYYYCYSSCFSYYSGGVVIFPQFKYDRLSFTSPSIDNRPISELTLR